MKHTSTVLETSIPIHKLVKLVDAEDIANDKTQTHDLTLEVNSIANQLQSQNLEALQSEHLMFTQPRDPNNKHKPAYKKYCSYCHKTNHRSISPLSLEIHMYYPTEMAKVLTPTSWFYSLYLHTPERLNVTYHPSRLEISFLLDSGASISVLNYPTYLTIAKLLNITCNNKTNHTSKTLTVANQTEVPILHYITTTLNTSIEQTFRQFIIPFAVADNIYTLLGTPFGGEYIQNINIQHFTLQFQYQSKDDPKTTKFF